MFTDHGTDLQDPPPYRPPAPYGVLFIPTADFTALENTANSPVNARTLPFLQFTPFQDRSGPTASPPPPPISPDQRPRYRAHSTGTRRLKLRRRPAPSAPAMSAPSSSPPPYSLTPPDLHIATKRASSSPHLRLVHPPPASPLASHSRQVFSDHARSRPRPAPTSDADEDESGAETDDGVVFRPGGGRALSLADTLRHRLLGKGKGRAANVAAVAPAGPDGGTEIRPITTAPGVLCAGETETEGEDSPRNLPTARIFRSRSSLSRQLRLPPSTAWMVPILFQLFRLLAVVPAFFGTLWNLYHIYRPPDDLNSWRVDYFVSVLWSLLTGWQCLQMTTGLLKRWRVYYSPFAALIRLLALQAICWPATHFTLTILDHDVRPLVCWAVIGTATSCSRSVQLWVTSNIIIAPTAPPQPHSHSHSQSHHHPPEEELEHLRKGRHRRWDWGQVGAQCALPAGVVYLVMAWAMVLQRELLGC